MKMTHKSFDPTRFLTTAGLILAGVVFFAITAALSNRVEPFQSEITPAPSMRLPTVDGLILPEMPANATQVDYGWQAYRLVCSACHAYDGSGLTGEWLSFWAPEDQNCWQSKCHALSHPPDGFVLPHYVPAIVGPGELDVYKTAQGLHDYIKKAMPWQDPGYLTDNEYWNITAYLIQANGFTLPKEPLSADTGADYLIGMESTPTAPAPTATITLTAAEASSQPGRALKVVGIILASSAVLGGVYVFWITRRKS